jgi:hypothetical protein
VFLPALPALVYIGLVVTLVGALTWLFAGRDEQGGRGGQPGRSGMLGRIGTPGAGGRHERVRSGPDRPDGYGWTAEGVAQHPIGPDDDPEFLAGL